MRKAKRSNMNYKKTKLMQNTHLTCKRKHKTGSPRQWFFVLFIMEQHQVRQWIRIQRQQLSFLREL